MYVSDKSAYLRGDLSRSSLRWMCPASSLRSLYNILVVHRRARAILQLHGPTATAIVCFKNALAPIEVCTSNEAVQHDNRSDHGTMWICNGWFHCRSLACGAAGESCKGSFVSQYIPEWWQHAKLPERGSVSNDIVLGHQLDLSWMTTELACETSL